MAMCDRNSFRMHCWDTILKQPVSISSPGLPAQEGLWSRLRNGATTKWLSARWARAALQNVGGLLSGAAAIFGVTFLAYIAILPGSFLMDDMRLVETDNPLSNGQLTPLSIWFQTDFPLANLIFRCEWLLWGGNPLWYHAVNIALHATSAVLLWRLLMWLRIRGAWLAGVLFALHPVCVNSVARIAELKNTLSLPFFLLSVIFYLQYEASALYPEQPQPNSSRRKAAVFYSVSLLAFVLALWAKTSVVMLPVVLLVCAGWRRGKLSRRDLVHASPHFAIALSFGLMSVWFQKYQALAGETLPATGFLERLAIASRVFWFYLGKAWVPLNLNVVYPRWNVNIHSVGAFVPLALLGAAIPVCWHFRRSWGRHVLFGLGVYAVLLFPAMGFFDAQYLTRWQVSDHLQYLPLIAPVSLAAAAVFGSRKFKIHRLAAAILLAVFFTLAFHRAGAFSTQEKLMRDTLAKNPAASDAHNDLGVVLAKRNDLSGATAEFAAAVQTDSNNATAQSNLGLMQALQSHATEAESHFLAALDRKPFDPQTHERLADLLHAQGRYREANAHLRVSLRFMPGAEVRLKLAGWLYEEGEFGEAAAQFRQALSENPDLPDALNNLAWLLATCGDGAVRNGAEAVRCAERACQLTEFKHSGFMSTLAAAYAEAGRFSEAVDTAQKALSLQDAAGETQFAMLNRQLIERYRAGEAFHQP